MRYLLVAVLLLAMACSVAQAATWDLVYQAALSNTGPTGNTVLRLSSPNSGTDPYGYLRYKPAVPFPLNDLTDLSVDFNMVQGPFAGGSPRFDIGIDFDNDGIWNDRLIMANWGTQPWGGGVPPTGWTNTGNFMGASLWSGVTFFDGNAQYTAAGLKAAFGAHNVMRAYVSLDSGWAGSQILDVTNFKINSDVYKPLVITRYTLTPKMLSPTKADFALGVNPFGFDWDSSAPGVASGAPSGFGDSSFFANVVNNGGDTDGYRTLRISPATLFGRAVKVSEIARLSYMTNKSGAQSDPDWRFSIYTPLQGSGNMGSWYHDRIQSHPAGALNLNAPAGQWNAWSTAASTNQLQFGTNRPGYTAENMLWSALPTIFGDQNVALIDIIAGAGSGGDTFSSQIDDVEIELTDGKVAVLDLAGNTLSLETTNIYVKPISVDSASRVIVDLDVANLTEPIVGLQSFLNFSSTYFSATTSDVSVAPGGGIWNEPIWSLGTTAGDLDVSVGLRFDTGASTQNDGTTARITLKPIAEGTTQMVFRADADPTNPDNLGNTILTAVNGDAIFPAKVNSVIITIDGTAPGVAITSPATGLQTNVASQPVSGTVSDTGSGVKSVTVNGVVATVTGGTWSATVPLTEGNNSITATAEDNAGNTATSSAITVLLDTVLPVLSIEIIPEHVGDLGCALVGDVIIKVAVIEAGSGLAARPTVTLVPAVPGVTFVEQNPAGTYVYRTSVGAYYANGTRTVDARATDNAGNVGDAPQAEFCVNKNQLMGKVQLEGQVSGSRDVTFVATGGDRAKTWTITVTDFTLTQVNYILTDVPNGTTGLSAKTAWSLREKMSFVLDANGQYYPHFVSDGVVGWNDATDHYLRGGDIYSSNSVNIQDYAVLKGNWGSTSLNNPADIDGNGAVGDNDYTLMKMNWFKGGDAQ